MTSDGEFTSSATDRAVHGRLASSILRLAEHAMTDVADREAAFEFQADSMETIIHLTRLKQDRPSDRVHPASTGLIGRLVDVAAATEQRLVLSDEL